MSTRRGGKQRRFRILPSVALTVVILLLPVGVYLWGRYGNVFRVNKVVLTGAKRVPRQRALTVLRARYLDRNLIGISSSDVQATLHVFLYFRAVRVDRDFPDTLRIAVTEYEPAACLLTPGGWYVVTAKGYVIAALPAAKATGATGTTGAASQTSGSGVASTSASAKGDDLAPALAARLRAGPPAPMQPALPAVFTTASVRVGQIVGDAQARAAALVAGSLPASLRAVAAYARVTAAGNVRVVLRNGLLVDFGAGTRLNAKMLALEAVLGSYAQKRVAPTYIDVSVPDRPLATPRLPG